MNARVRAAGLDFGTTNSAIAIVDESGAVRLARFADVDRTAETETFRSIRFSNRRRKSPALRPRCQ